MASERSENKVKGGLLQREWVTQVDYESSARSGKDSFTLKVLQWNVLADGIYIVLLSM